ncbi:hypothetical protein D3C84_1007260 [compost metagenome]
MGRDRQAGGNIDPLDVEQTFERSQGNGQCHCAGTWAADLQRLGQVFEPCGVGLRYQRWRLLGEQAARQIDHSATGRLGPRGKTAGDGRAGSEKGQFDLAEIEAVDLAHAQTLVAEHNTAAG